MDDIEKLSCKEEIMEISDIEHSANDDNKDAEEMPKKKKRRRREIDMIKISDDDDSDEDSGQKKVHLSPGPHSPASHREPRTCVLKASQKRRPLSRLLEQLLRNLEKRDPHQFFAWPVNDNFAPGYSDIIRRPMDFCTIKQKIDDNEYRSLNCFINDFKLMCNNAMKYNKAGTVYHKAARRLLHAGLRQLAPAKLRPLGAILTYMYEIPLRELGFDIGSRHLHKAKRSSPLKSGGEENDAHSDSAGSRPDSGDNAKISQMEAARERNRRRLAKKAFPYMDAEGKTTLCIVTGENVDDKQPTLKQYIGRLTQGTSTLHIPREDRRNLVKGVKPLNYGPFGSYAPSYDGTFATLTKEQSHLLYHTLPSERGEGGQGALRFEADSPWALLYDMEAMFPAAPAAHATEAEAEAEAEGGDAEAEVRVDVDALRSLAELGVDVDFVSELEEEIVASQRDYGIAGALRHTLRLLARAEREQAARLAAGAAGGAGAARAGPGAGEREAARGAAACLRAMAARVPPRLLAPRPALQRALGVTLAHLDTPLRVDDLGELDGGGGSD